MTENTYSMTIDGVSVAGNTSLPVMNPADDSIVGYAPQCNTVELENAITAARRAQPLWADVSDEKRKAACNAIADVIEKHSEELSVLLTKEQGKPVKGIGSEVELQGCVVWARSVSTLELEVKVLQDDSAAYIEQHRIPMGVVASITPWNWPLMIAIWHIVPAIRAGNTVVIKPSPFTPLSTLRMIELINTVLPKGVLNTVCGDGDIGNQLTSHKDIAKIVFTGSTETGRKIMQSAAGTIKRLTLELGGNDAGIVLDDCDPSQIAEGLFWGAFSNSGQTCAALKRLFVPDSLYSDVCSELVKLAEQVPVGNGLEDGTLLGPLQNSAQLKKVIELVDDARANGGTVLCGGSPTPGPGNFYPVTLVADVTTGCRLVDEEQFGTALPIIRYEHIDDAIEQANHLDFGLAASVWSSSTERASTVAKRLEAGTVYINQHGALAPHVPFGGIKESGLGVEFSQEGLDAYTDIKIFNTNLN